jgi:hypothetical protein
VNISHQYIFTISDVRGKGQITRVFLSPFPFTPTSLGILDLLQDVSMNETFKQAYALLLSGFTESANLKKISTSPNLPMLLSEALRYI